MNPQTPFCPNLDCPARGQVGRGNISVHSHSQCRYRCRECRQTFAATKAPHFTGCTRPASCSPRSSRCWHMAVRCRPLLPPFTETNAPSQTGKRVPGRTVKACTNT